MKKHLVIDMSFFTVSFSRFTPSRSVGAPPSQNLAVKEFCFVPRGKCGGFFVKFLAATFPGNQRAKICKICRQIFAAFFARVCEKIRLNFALRKFLHNDQGSRIKNASQLSQDTCPPQAKAYSLISGSRPFWLCFPSDC